MSFLSDTQLDELKGKLSNDASVLGKQYRSRKQDVHMLSVNHAEVEEYEREGWIKEKVLKTKTRLVKPKDLSKQIEDRTWCQLYELGFRYLNRSDDFHLPFERGSKGSTKQIDVIAINEVEKIALLVECKSKKSKGKVYFKDEFEVLRLRLDGMTKSIKALLGQDYKVKYLFATHNINIAPDSADFERLEKARAFLYSDNHYEYVNSLIKNYKSAAIYQFMGLIFKGDKISKESIRLPAVLGKMADRKYYMFSIEPSLLLKFGYVLHRTRANEEEFPTYQRLLVPSRLTGINKFIQGDGYFPNSIIVNFSHMFGKRNRVRFESSGREKGAAEIGTLIIPNMYGLAYIIDGQHRVYGYAGTECAEKHTIPVVAFDGLATSEQLKIFMDINENQKAVSANLRLDLEEDLFWDSDRLDSRIKALRSSIVKGLNVADSPYEGKISVGEDKSTLTFTPLINAFKKSSLLPSAKGNKVLSDNLSAPLYDVSNHDYSKEMNLAKKRIVSLVSNVSSFMERDFPELFESDTPLLMTNRGIYAFIGAISSLNEHLTTLGEVSIKTAVSVRVEKMEPYLVALGTGLINMTSADVESMSKQYGGGADVAWLSTFNLHIHRAYENYYPESLKDWEERQNDVLQNEGRALGVEIEKHIKKVVLKQLKELYGKNWELEISSIKRQCMQRAEEENEKNYKDKVGETNIPWTDMFNIVDYKKIISDHWTKSLSSDDDFKTFEERFSLDIGRGYNSKSERLKWMDVFKGHRNLWTHEGTKEKRLNKEEVGVIKLIYDGLNISV